jgi:hypothetical protein
MIITAFIPKTELSLIIPEFVEEIFNIDRERVEEQLNPILNTLLDNIVCFIEYPYVDKFYRDSYYSFFSRKHNPYNRNSIRISFFNDELDTENYFNLDNKEIEKFFWGFISLRPTTYRIIGHSFINPKALKSNKFVCCLVKKAVLINGKKLIIDGFPFISQDNESITCSEATIINLFDYFGNKYSEYSTILPSQVAKILSRQSYQRQLPAHGLPTENISYVLKKLGFGTVVYSSDNDAKKKSSDIYTSNEFKELLFMYIESGIPIIATLSTQQSHHAVLVIGREDIQEEIVYSKKTFLRFGKNQFEFSNVFKRLLVMNDNHSPYELIDYYEPIYDFDVQKYYQFKSFIIPLYSKVHLDAYQFKQFFHIVLENLQSDPETEHVKFTEDEDYIYRFYLTSSKSYKNYISNSKFISNEFKSITISKTMPKFIWVGEIIKGNKISPIQEVQSIVVVDATETGLTGHLIFATNSRFLIIKNSDILNTVSKQDSLDKRYQIFDFGKEMFFTFANNLKGAHTKWQS